MKLLVVVDMQNDFIDGSLGTKEAQAIVERVAQKVADYRKSGDRVIFTMDTHGKDYLQTQEGRHLPVMHCIRGTNGWELCPALKDAADAPGCIVYEKDAFGSREYAADLQNGRFADVDEVELVGLCTDICVISNAMLTKAFAPQIPVKVDAACCAGVTPESHQNALEAMKMCQIQIC